MRIRAFLFVSILSTILYTQAAGTVLYVDDDANGLNNGTSWENAYTYLQDALKGTQNVIKPVEIRIAQGTYKPDLGAGITQGDRAATFDLVNNVSLLGGYAGLGQADPNARNIELYETILSGDLNNNDIKNPSISNLINEHGRKENSFRVITSRSIRNTNTIDGLTIKSGNANDPNYSTGSGIYNYYSALKVNNCTFKENSASNGGGVCNYSDSPRFTNCKFMDNMAVDNGGGIYNYRSTASLSNCTISQNAAKNGGGIYNSYSDLILTNCTFSSNVIKTNGGGIYNDISNPKITDCLFNSNTAASDGGGMYNYSNSNPALTKCTFSENKANSNGAGMCNEESSPTINNCTFTENQSKNGGGMYNHNNSKPVITNCAFNKNKADTSGAGVYNNNSIPTITSCTFTENNTIGSGGGIYNYNNGSFKITYCTFHKNSAQEGGGMYNTASSPTLTDCSFTENESTAAGGGIYITLCSPKIIDCIFNKNKTLDYGGGIANFGSNPTISGSLFSENASQNGGGGIYNYNVSKPIITDCIFSKNHAKTLGGGMYNLNSDPTLTDCTLSENSTENNGGGMCNKESNPSMTNCTFKRNLAEISGGAIYNLSSNISSTTKCMFIENTAENSGGAILNEKCAAAFPNSIFLGNSAQYGGGINNTDNSNILINNSVFEGNVSLYGDAVSSFSSIEPENTVLQSNVKITNCILWDDGQEIFNDSASIITIAYCDVKNGEYKFYDPNEKMICGEGNFESDPCFACPGFWNSNGTPDDANDDFYAAGDYHLKSQVGRYDPNSKIWVTDEVTSQCIDAGDPITPLYFEPYPNGDRINIGIYGGTKEASKSLYDIDYFSQAYSPEPFDGAYSIALDPILYWSSDPNVTEHELYFGTTEFPPFLRKQTETVFDPGALKKNTQYFWRIDDLDNSLNRVSGEIWTFVTGKMPDHPYNPTPLNDEENVNYGITLSWNPGSNALTRIYYYNLYFGTDFNDVCNATANNPLDVLVYSNKTLSDANEYKPGNLKLNQKYYWRVDDITDTRLGTVKTKGDIWSFTTGSKPAHAYYPYPENNSSEIPLNAIFSWFPGTSNPAAYDVYFGTDFNDVKDATKTNPLGCLVSIAQDSNYYEPIELNFTRKYYWRIDETDSNGVITKGETWSFITGPQPDYSYNPNPFNHAKNVNYDVTLTWHKGLMSRYSRIYYHQIYLGTDFNDVYNATIDNPLGVLASSRNDPNSYNPSNLKCNQTYYWRIDDVTSSVMKGDIWSFTTGSKPVNACYPYPADKAINVPWGIILSWSPGSLNPVNYDVYFGINFNDVNNATIANPLNSLVSIAQDSNYYDPGELYYPQKYYWRVDEADSNGVVVKGKTWSFTTLSKRRACFPADTPVWVDGNMIEITKVVEGQKVGKTDCGISTSGSIKGLEEHYPGINPCYEMTLESGNAITIVHSHYFMTVSGEWKKIEELAAGMQLQTMNGPITIKSVIKKAEPFVGKSYNLILDGSEQYFVGIDGVIALDCSKKIWEILEEARK